MNDQDLVNVGTEHFSGVSSESPRPAQSEGLAGRELDAAVAERVMEWTRYRGLEIEPPPTTTQTIFCDWDYTGQLAIYRGGRVRGSAERWSPSTDIAAAMEVAEKMRGHGFTVEISSDHPDPEWDVVFVWREILTPNAHKVIKKGEASNNSLPEAICRAALAAVAHNAPAQEMETQKVG